MLNKYLKSNLIVPINLGKIKPTNQTIGQLLRVCYWTIVIWLIVFNYTHSGVVTQANCIRAQIKLP